MLVFSGDVMASRETSVVAPIAKALTFAPVIDSEDTCSVSLPTFETKITEPGRVVPTLWFPKSTP